MGFLFPSIVAWWVNRQLIKEYEKKDLDKVATSWEEKLKKFSVEALQRIVDDICNAEMQRKNTIESKVMSLFEGIGFAASILSVAILFNQQRIIFILLLLPMTNFIIAGICSWSVARVAKYHVFTTLHDFDYDLSQTAGHSSEDCKRYWIAKRLASTERNTNLLLAKSNLLSAAYQHFFLGLLFIIPILVLLICCI